ncbi:MAG: nicotinate-nucleotide adenylyltransferase [Planctomycetaceae bacterium]
MRVGIFGGTFDPVHYGHLLLAEQCREQCQLDSIWFLPSGLPPHKQDAEITPGSVRVEMLRLAISGHDDFTINDMELKRTGPTFTVDTLQQIHKEEDNPELKLFFLMGADSLLELKTWREPDRIAQLATIVAVNREGLSLPNPDQLCRELGSELMSRVVSVAIPRLDLSSSDIRQRVREGKSIRYMTPRAVEVFIQQRKLYRPAE